MLRELNHQVERRDPLSQRALANRFNCSLGTINKAIDESLGKVTRRKSRVHQLSDRLIRKRLSAAKEVLREEILPERMQHLVTLDESWLFLDDCNKKSPICYVDAGDHVPENWTEVRHETFGPKIMTVGILTGLGPVDLIFVPSKLKIVRNSTGCFL